MKRKAILLLCAVLAAGAALYGCGVQNGGTASSGLAEPVSQAESQAESQTAVSEGETQSSGRPVNDHIVFTDTVYETERVRLIYPVVSQMDDASVEEKVNRLIETGNQLGPKQYKDTAVLEGVVETTFQDGETLSLLYRWTLKNPEENAGYPAAYTHSLVIDLRTGEQRHLNDSASVHRIYYQLRYGLYQVVTGEGETDTQGRIAVRNLLRNGALSADKLATADYPLSGTFPPTLYSYVTQDKIGLIVPASEKVGGPVQVEFDRKDVTLAPAG